MHIPLSLCYGENLQQLKFFLCTSKTLLLLKDVLYIWIQPEDKYDWQLTPNIISKTQKSGWIQKYVNTQF